jgi:hypothetical protein
MSGVHERDAPGLVIYYMQVKWQRTVTCSSFLQEDKDGKLSHDARILTVCGHSLCDRWLRSFMWAAIVSVRIFLFFLDLYFDSLSLSLSLSACHWNSCVSELDTTRETAFRNAQKNKGLVPSWPKCPTCLAEIKVENEKGLRTSCGIKNYKLCDIIDILKNRTKPHS